MKPFEPNESDLIVDGFLAESSLPVSGCEQCPYLPEQQASSEGFFVDTEMEADIYRGRFRLNEAIYTRYCQPRTVIMHPLPRDSRAEANELDPDLNENPNLAIFRQTDNGVLVRMALFALVLDVVHLVRRHESPVSWYTGKRFAE